MSRMPALSLAAVPGRRRATLELAGEIERRGFTGIYCPSTVANVTLCAALAQVTNEIHFGTSIAPIYARTVLDYAQTISFIHEISGGRFRFGIGVSHGPSLKRMGVTAGKPLSDTRDFVAELKAVQRVGELPPIVLATMRRKMIALAGEIGDGMVFANASRSFMAASLAALPEDKRNDDNFYIGNMIPTCIDDDVEAAKAVNRRTLSTYVQLPNYRNYWKESGYAEEMAGVEAAVAAGEPDKIAGHLSDKWLADNTLFGSVAQVRDGLEAWFDAGVHTPILVPSSAITATSWWRSRKCSRLSAKQAAGGVAMTEKIDCLLIGKWRTVEADIWDRDYLDLVEPAYIAFKDSGRGEFSFGCINGGFEFEYSRRIVFFKWLGFDEMDDVGGDGSADLEDDGSIEIEIRFDSGDEAILKAQRW